MKTVLGTRVLAAYTVISIVWGSTYLAIRIGVQHLPPALFGAVRFLTAGTVLLTLALALGQRLPGRGRDWVTSIVVGIMLLGIANGLVIWSEQFVESSLAAVMIVTGGLWMAIFDALIPGSDSMPTGRQFAALVAGFGGTVLLVGAKLDTLGEAGLLGPTALVLSSACWSLGSVYAKRRAVQTGPYVNAALQMLAGGSVLLVVGLLHGEAAAFHPTLPGLGALAYLIVFGSIVAYTAYVYLLRHAAPAFIGTSVYVNTVVAVLLGWLLLDERVTLKTFVAIAVILGSVILVRGESSGPARGQGPAAAKGEA